MVTRALLRRVLRIEDVDFPQQDQQTVVELLAQQAPVILAANHPEFFTDWLVDLEITSQCAPHAGFLATDAVVDLHPLGRRLWRVLGVFVAAPLNGSAQTMVQRALDGHGVFIHPEGDVYWTGDHVQPLRRGAVGIARQAARLTPGGRAQVVPVVWRYCFRHDVRPALLLELREIASHLGVKDFSPATLEDGLLRLHWECLGRQDRNLGLHGSLGELDADTYFAQHSAALQRCVERAEALLGPGPGEWIGRVRRLQDTAWSASGPHTEPARKYVMEACRLLPFTPATYGGATLTQEQVAECIKRLRAGMLNRTLWERVTNLVPRPAGPRTLHIRVGEPMDVVGDGAELRPQMEELRRRMQAALPGVGADSARWSVPNPFRVADP